MANRPLSAIPRPSGERRAVGAGAAWWGEHLARPPVTRATHRAAAALRRAAVLVAAAAIAAVHSTPAQEAGLDGLHGLIIDEETLPLDELGQPLLDEVPGARQLEPLPAELEERLLDLSAQRTAIGETSSSGAAEAAFPALPGEADAPARRDSIDRDPDRLRAVPPMPRAR